MSDFYHTYPEDFRLMKEIDLIHSVHRFNGAVWLKTETVKLGSKGVNLQRCYWRSEENDIELTEFTSFRFASWTFQKYGGWVKRRTKTN